MRIDYPDYTPEQFWDDLRYRTKPKKRKGKSSLVRFGRYRRMEQLNELYRATKNTAYAVQAQTLRRRMTQPYRILIRIDGKAIEYGFSPLIQIENIERLMAELSACRTEQQADELTEQFRKQNRIL